jgi:hypothetical protein
MGSGMFGFGSAYATNTPTYFDIRSDEVQSHSISLQLLTASLKRLEASTLRLPREDEEAGYGHLNGTVVLCLNKPLYMNDIKVHMRGKHHAK